MTRLRAIILALVLLPCQPVLAVDTDAVVGGAVGGGLGAAVGSEVGGREGAIVGSAVGAAIGTAIATDADEPEPVVTRVHVESDSRPGPPAHAYRAPPGHVKHKRKKHP